mgnify:CR=1 FL=1
MMEDYSIKIYSFVLDEPKAESLGFKENEERLDR